MTTMQYDSTAATAAQWWAEQLATRSTLPPLDIGPDLARPARLIATMVAATAPPAAATVQLFRHALATQIRADLEEAGGWMQIRMDWDPDRTLRAALSAAGLADVGKLHLPMKTTMSIRPGEIMVHPPEEPDFDLAIP